MSSPASLGLTKEGNEYRILGKKGGLIKINKLTVPQLKAYGAKYTTFTNKNRTKKQVLNKIYAAKTKLRTSANSGNEFASALLALQNQPPKSSSPYNANMAAAQALAALGAKNKPAGKTRVNALMQVAAQKPSASSSVAAASLGLLPNLGASGGYRFKGARGPKKANKTMTVAALKAYAAKHGVKANTLRKKENILAAIHRKKYGGSSSSSSRSSSGPVVISHAQAAALLKARPRSSNGPHKRPAPRPKVQGPAAKPKRLTAGELNKLLGLN